MQRCLVSVRASLAGIAAAFAACALFAVLSSFTLSNERLAEVVRTAIAENELGYAARTNEDFFTDCALLEMQHLRQGGVFLRALDTRFLMREGEHSCDSLRTLVLGTDAERASLPSAVSYFNYPFGSRHLEAFVLSIVDFGAAARLYKMFSYGSVALLFVIMLWRAPATAILLAPIPLFLIYAFSFHHLGGNLGHAPGYFVGFIALSVFVGVPRWFQGIPARLAFAGALGVIGTYFDLLDGVIPTLLALTIVLNHFFYVRGKNDQRHCLIEAMTQAVSIFGCFLTAYVVVTVSRLGLLWLSGIDISAFATNLAFRLSDNAGMKVTFGMNMDALMTVRYQMTSGGAASANWVFVAGILGWIFTLFVGLFSLVLHRPTSRDVLLNVLVLAGVSIGIFAWYWRFAGHTYVHVLLMVRLLALPLACGVVAAMLMAIEARRLRMPTPATAASLCVAAFLAVLAMHTYWTLGLSPSRAEGRFTNAQADVVSCSQLGLYPDGQPDGVIEIRFRKSAPPLAYVGVGTSDQANIQLVRGDPAGAYHTGYLHYPLGISREPGGALLNRRDGIFTFRAGREQHVYAHYCHDGHDTPSSTYELKIDGITVPIASR